MLELYLGINIDGNGLNVGLIDVEGTRIINLPEVSFEPENLNNANLTRFLIEKIKKAIKIAGDNKIIAIGIGSPGPLEPETGVIEYPPNMNIRNFQVVKILTEEFPSIPTFLINNADAALLGEAWKGVAKTFKDVVMLTLGTGVGSGVMARGRLQRGRGRGAEWGHTTIYGNGESRLCSCLNFNCLEAFVGVEGLLKTYCQLFGVSRLDILPENARLILAEFAEVVNSDIKQSNFHRVADAYCLNLVEGIRNIICVHNPECLVLGGSIIQNNRYLFETIKEKMKKTDNRMVSLLKGTKIGLAHLKRPGLVGSAKHAMNRCEAILERERLEHGVFS